MKKTTFLTFLFSGCVTLSFAQDPVFRNTNQSLVSFNPSFAGSNGLLRYQMAFRNQQTMFGQSENSVNNDIDFFIRKIKAGFALGIHNNGFGNDRVKTTATCFTYAQQLFINDDLKVVPSLQISSVKRTHDMSPANPFPARNPAVTLSKNYADLNAGVLFVFREEFFTGLSLLHLTEPNVSVIGEPLRLPLAVNLHGSYTTRTSSYNLLQFFYRYSYSNRSHFHQVSVNTVFFNHMMAGVGFSTYFTPMAHIGFRSHSFAFMVALEVPYTFDEGVSAAWEITASYNLRRKESRFRLTTFETW